MITHRSPFSFWKLIKSRQVFTVSSLLKSRVLQQHLHKSNIMQLIHLLLPLLVCLNSKASAWEPYCPPSTDDYPVFLPHPTDCSLYYMCSLDRPHLMSCPSPLVFDTSLNVCNWPQNVDCTPHQEEPTTEVVFSFRNWFGEGSKRTNRCLWFLWMSSFDVTILKNGHCLSP